MLSLNVGFISLENRQRYSNFIKGVCIYIQLSCIHVFLIIEAREVNSVEVGTTLLEEIFSDLPPL